MSSKYVHTCISACVYLTARLSSFIKMSVGREGTARISGLSHVWLYDVLNTLLWCEILRAERNDFVPQEYILKSTSYIYCEISTSLAYDDT